MLSPDWAFTAAKAQADVDQDSDNPGADQKSQQKTPRKNCLTSLSEPLKKND